jgi:hypothetical protein
MNSTKANVKCLTCSKDFYKRKSEITKYPHHYCSIKCRQSRNLEANSQSCANCSNVLVRHPCIREKYDNYFCDKDCESAFKNKRIKRNCKICNIEIEVSQCEIDTNFFCSYKCAGKAKRKGIEFNCHWCQKIILRTPSQIKKRKLIFCSCSCSSKHYQRINQGKRKSYAEIFLADLIKADFPQLTILDNNRQLIPSGLEIDIFIEEFKIAIELNGPCHYFNIYGEATLKKVQTNDAIKHAEIQQAGYPFIILDISTINDYKKLEKFLLIQYENNIKPLIS